MINFSIVIGVYNKEKYITHTLQSVLDQSYAHFELIIINDGSTDSSEEQILAFTDPRINYYKQENLGAGAARNKAIELAKHNYIALLDADDIWDKNYLESQASLITKYPKKSVFSCAIQQQIGKRLIAKKYAIPKDTIGIYNYFEASAQTSLLHSSSTILHKDVLKTVGFYNPNIISGQDTDLYVRIGIKYSVVFNPKILVTYTINDDSLWRSISTVTDRVDFANYGETEKNNEALKKFLDINRFSLAIQAKKWNEKKSFKKLVSAINQQNLNKKQRFLLKQPSIILRFLSTIKKWMEKSGLGFTIFGQ